MKSKVLVICSGGIDSAVMATMYRWEELTLMTFNYGQKGYREIGAAQDLAQLLTAEIEIIDISFLKDIYGDSTQLTSDQVDIEDKYTQSVVVPLRNAMFLQVAMVYAYTEGIDRVVLGSHLDDIAEVDGERLYPDCSPEFFKAFELAMDLGTFRGDKRVEIVSASTLGLTKTDLIRKGHQALGDFIFKTWSCYHSGKFHCGVCEACRNRKKAFAEAEVGDMTVYEDDIGVLVKDIE